MTLQLEICMLIKRAERRSEKEQVSGRSMPVKLDSLPPSRTEESQRSEAPPVSEKSGGPTQVATRAKAEPLQQAMAF